MVCLRRLEGVSDVNACHRLPSTVSVGGGGGDGGVLVIVVVCW